MLWFRPVYLVPVLYSMLLSCSGAQSTSENTTATDTTPTEEPATVPLVAPALNMPSLAGLPIDVLRQKLGAPVEAAAQPPRQEPTARQLRQGAGNTWVNTFAVNGSTLVATFNATTRRVRDIVLLGTDEDELFRRAGLSQNAPNYIVLPVSDSTDLNRLTGIRMIAHAVGAR